MLRTLGVHVLSLALVGPAPEDTSVQRADQSVPAVGLVPHAAPEREELELQGDPTEEEEQADPEVSVIYMPAKKKVQGIKSPTSPLGCDDEVGCKGLLIGGATFGGLGLIGVGTGTALHVRSDRPIASDPTSMRSTRAAGVIVITTGVSFAVFSALMLITALRGRVKRPSRTAVLDPARPGTIRF